MDADEPPARSSSHQVTTETAARVRAGDVSAADMGTTRSGGPVLRIIIGCVKVTLMRANTGRFGWESVRTAFQISKQKLLQGA